MPRIPRGQVAGHAYHVLNRGNGGAVVFHKDGDSYAFPTYWPRGSVCWDQISSFNISEASFDPVEHLLQLRISFST